MLRIFPDISIMLEEIGVFKANVIAELLYPFTKFITLKIVWSKEKQKNYKKV